MSRPFQPMFYEFFAGGGMARAGLGAGWRCLFANDFDEKKGRAYRENWGSGELKIADVASLETADLPGKADLAWASFPCQDLSLAGSGRGLKGERSGTFWTFWNLMKGLARESRKPRLIVLENVCGALTSHEGRDFAAICGAIRDEGFRLGAFVADAELFVPQSRPRLFFIAVDRHTPIPDGVSASAPLHPWHTRALQSAYSKLDREAQSAWIWWNLPNPPDRTLQLSDVIEDNPQNPAWFTPNEVDYLLSLMSPANHAKIGEARACAGRVVGGVYRRTRYDQGRREQRAEVRFDGLSGCLRTPGGGSSRQVVIVVEGDSVRARLISARETARLMGLSDEYRLPQAYNEAYHLTGDGVVVPVVRHIAANILEPILNAARKTAAA